MMSAAVAVVPHNRLKFGVAKGMMCRVSIHLRLAHTDILVTLDPAFLGSVRCLYLVRIQLLLVIEL